MLIVDPPATAGGTDLVQGPALCSEENRNKLTPGGVSQLSQKLYRG